MLSLKNSLIILPLLLLAIIGCKRGEEEPVEEKPIKTEENRPCDNTCVFAYDGTCDDGGPDAKFSYCDFGTDCEDCGKRNVITVKD